VAALIWSHHPECANYQIRYAIAATAKSLTDGSEGGTAAGCNEKFGHGLIQAKAALDFLDSNPCSSNWGSEAREGGCYASSSSASYGGGGQLQAQAMNLEAKTDEKGKDDKKSPKKEKGKP